MHHDLADAHAKLNLAQAAPRSSDQLANRAQEVRSGSAPIAIKSACVSDNYIKLAEPFAGLVMAYDFKY